jgi:hypothetical protein
MHFFHKLFCVPIKIGTEGTDGSKVGKVPALLESPCLREVSDNRLQSKQVLSSRGICYRRNKRVTSEERDFQMEGSQNSLLKC